MKPAILYVFGGEKAQGAEIVIERLMAYNAHNVDIHLFISPGEFATKLLKEKKPYKISLVEDLRKLNRGTSSGYLFYLKAIKRYFTISYKVNRYAKKNKISIVHTNTIVPTSYLIPSVIFDKIFSNRRKYIWSDHDMRYFSKLENYLATTCVNLYSKTLAVSGAVKKKYSRHDKVTVLYNGLDTNVFKKDDNARTTFRCEYNVPANAVVVGMAGKITPDKGQLEVAKVFEEVSGLFPEAVLLLAGQFDDNTPSYNEEVKTLVRSNGKIIYSGFLNNINAFYNGCDVLINNSNNTRSESLGTSIYEAMACEKVVLASNTGGTPEIISDRTDGFLFDVENMESLKTNLRFILTNLEQLQLVKTNARKKVSHNFNIVTMVKEYNNLISCECGASKGSCSKKSS